MKPKSLIKFAQANAYEIKQLNDKYLMQTAMSSKRTCVLRPLILPRFTKLLMTPKERKEYTKRSCTLTGHMDVDRAVEWVRWWVNQ